jgi:hypothetical protein
MMDKLQDLGAISGSREPSPSSTGLGPSGFDPERVEILARRCEHTQEADAKLDREIWLAVVATPHERALVMAGRELHGETEANFRVDWMADGVRYTHSVDAALSLVPEGWEWQLENTGGDTFGPFVAKFGQLHDIEAKTLPLAITAAALTAIATEARRAETTQIGSVHEGADPKGIAQHKGHTQSSGGNTND